MAAERDAATRRLGELGLSPRLDMAAVVDEAVRVTFVDDVELDALRAEANRCWRRSAAVTYALTGQGTWPARSLAQHDGVVHLAVAVIEKGWELLDEHGSAPAG